VTDEEWSFVTPYRTLMREDAPQREHSLREVFNGLRYLVRGGKAWRMLPDDLPLWDVVYGKTRRWMDAGVFDAVTQDL
jgi:transposase